MVKDIEYISPIPHSLKDDAWIYFNIASTGFMGGINKWAIKR
jgi:hypothetical protein